MAIRKSSGSGIPSGNNAGRPANPGIGQLYSNGEAARLELYTQASGWQNIIQETPGVSSITGNYLESTNSGVITISGTNFVSGAYATAIGSNGVQIDAVSTTFNSLVQLTATFTGLSSANEPYDIKVTNPSNLFGMLPDALYVNNNPAWTTAAGSLGAFAEQVNVTISALSVSDDSTITYSLANGSSLPSGVTLSSNGVISGTLPDISSNTTYTFTVNATDGLNPTISRTFSFISNAAPVWSTASGVLGTFNENTSISVTVAATDASDSVVYSLANGSSLPSPLVLNSSTGVISGTLPSVTTSTTYTFTINASDGLNTVPRSFSIVSLDTVPSEYLVVAGGGGGSSIIGGGGGAGGLLSGTAALPVSSSLLVTVGAGGRGGSGYGASDYVSEAGYPGFDSILGSITAIGGGGAAGWDANGPNITFAGQRPWTKNGGSGGGGSGTDSGQQHPGFPNRTGGTATFGQGFNGGNGSDPHGSGGGGAGGVGGTQSINGNINGGIGVQSSITGAATHYAGGGGGGRRTSGGGNGPSAGGNGGGGAGGAGNSFNSNQNGAANTGGGGGGGNYEGPSPSSQAGGNGGSGVVIIAYPNTFPAITTIPGTLTYDQPTRSGYRVYRFTAGSGTITI